MLHKNQFLPGVKRGMSLGFFGVTWLLVTTLTSLKEEQFWFARQGGATLCTHRSCQILDRDSYAIHAIQFSLEAMSKNAANKAIITCVILQSHLADDL